MKKYMKFFCIFANLGLQMLGNVSAIIPVLEEQLVKKHNLVTKEDILDAVAIGRCGPGAASINTIVFLGNKIAGFLGGITAVLAFSFFPLIIIIIISSFINRFLENELVISIFKSISVSLCVKIIESIANLIKDILIDKLNIFVFISVLVLAIFTNIPSVFYIVFSIILGIAWMISTKIKNYVNGIDKTKTS